MDAFLIVPVIVITVLLAWLVTLLFSGQGNNTPPTSTNNAAAKKKKQRKLVFSPADNNKFTASDWALITRLGLSTDSPNIVTIALNSQDILGGAWPSDNSLRSILEALNRVSNLFLLLEASSDAAEECVAANLTEFLPDAFPKHMILFYQSEIGKIAITRQLKPILHVDFDPYTCDQLAAHIRYVVHYLRTSTTAGTVAPVGERELPRKSDKWESIRSLGGILTASSNK